MIWEVLIGGFFDAVAALLGSVYGLVPAPPSWLQGDALETVAATVGGVGQWVPVEHTINVAASVVSAYVTAGFVGVGRSFVSHLTGGGGAA